MQNQPQLTLHACSKVGDNDDGRVVIQADFVSKSQTLFRWKGRFFVIIERKRR